MAVVNINTIKNWFKTGMIPIQDQFWSVFDSYRHKNDNIPVAEVEGINELLATRASQQVLDNHLAQKGAPNGYAPLDEFTKLASQYLNIVNDLVTGGATALLSAEQGKALQTQVNAINTLLTSDNVNLDTVQELVDAIETVQLSLSTILVNDLTTGGITKALTAEMGKSLKLSKQAKIISEDSYGNAEDTLNNWQFDTNDRIHVVAIGDSISLGAWSDLNNINWIFKGCIGLVGRSLKKIYGDGGQGFFPLFQTPTNNYWTRSNGWTPNEDYGPFGACYYTTQNDATFELSGIEGDNAEIYYVNNSAVTFSYSVDNGAFVSVISSPPYNNSVAKVAFSLGSLGLHSIKVKGASSGILFLQGASIYTGTKGIVVHNISRSGATADIAAIRFSDRFSPMIQHFSPKLTFLNFLANDFVYQDIPIHSIANYTADMNTIATAIKELGSDLIIWQPPKGTKLPNANTFTLNQYEDASKLAAINTNSAWIDFHADWGDSNLSKMYDDQHPNEVGHKYIASKFLRFLRLFT